MLNRTGQKKWRTRSAYFPYHQAHTVVISIRHGRIEIYTRAIPACLADKRVYRFLALARN